MFNVGFSEMLVIGIVALVIFGPKKLPEIGRALGRGLREFRKAASDVMEETEGDMTEGTKDGSKGKER